MLVKIEMKRTELPKRLDWNTIRDHAQPESAAALTLQMTAIRAYKADESLCNMVVK